MTHLLFSRSNGSVSLEKEEQAAADELHLQALLDVGVEKLQQLRDVRKRQHQQRNLQLTGDHHRGKNDSNSINKREEWFCSFIFILFYLDLTFLMTSKT